MIDVVPDAPHRPVSSERALHANALAFAWMLAAMVGAGTITVLSAQSGWRLVAPPVIMLLYLGYGYYSPGRNTAKLADSIYFLGFLWTLYALINEFVFRRASISNADSVYRVFGYALVTTAVGMFFRLTLLQFHETASDQMEEATDELDLRLEALTSEFTRAETQLSQWRESSAKAMTAFDQELRNAQGSVRSRIEAVHTEAALALAGTVTDAVLPLVDELKQVTPLTRKMRTAVSTLEKATTLSVDGISQSSMAFVGTLTENVEAVNKTLSGSLGRAGAVLENAATNYALSLTRQGEATIAALNNTEQAAARLVQLLDRVQAASTQLSNDLAAAKHRVEDLPRAVAVATSAVNDAKATGVAALQSVVDDTVAAVSAAKEAATAINQTVDEVVDFTRKRMV
jgi:hypothetical protein